MKRGGALLVVLVALFATACSRANNPDAQPASTPAATANAPKRIVSQLPSLTETLFDLGLGEQVVGVTDYCLHPDEAKTRPKIGGLFNPNFERIVLLRPDVIVLQDKQRNFVDRYQSLGIEALTFSTSHMADVLVSIREMGKLFGREDKAAALVESVETHFRAIRETAATKPHPRTLLVIGHDPGSLQGLYVAAKGSFHDELLTAAGGENVIDDNGSEYPPITKDVVVDRSPDVILLLINEPAVSPERIRDELRLWQPLQTVEAVKHGRIRIVAGDDILIPGPRMADAAESIQRALQADDNGAQP